MSAGIFNLTDSNAIEQGADFSFSLIYKDVNNNPVNLTSATITGQIKMDWNTSALASFTITKHSPATDGYVGVSLPASASASIAPGRYKYDIRISLSGGVSHIIKGMCDVVESVTFS
jgi:hypothetical protein